MGGGGRVCGRIYSIRELHQALGVLGTIVNCDLKKRGCDIGEHTHTHTHTHTCTHRTVLICAARPHGQGNYGVRNGAWIGEAMGTLLNHSHNNITCHLKVASHGKSVDVRIR